MWKWIQAVFRQRVKQTLGKAVFINIDIITGTLYSL